MRHLLLTRFSVPTALGGRMRKMDADDVYLQYRYSLFKRFCLPSVRAQQVKAFVWFVFFGAETPEWFRIKLEEHENNEDFVPLFSPTFGGALDSVREWLRINAKQGEHIITSRLDNDDSISADYVATIQAGVDPKLDKQYFDLQYGHQVVVRSEKVSDWKFYGLKMARNPFVSMVERMSEAPQLVYHCKHGSMKPNIVQAPVVAVAGGPYWLQVLHGKNIGNGLMSRSVVPPNYKAFPWLEAYVNLGLPD